MNSSIKQLYAALEIKENEIRIAVSEYFNTRFNIIRYGKYFAEGFEGMRIKDHDLALASLRNAFEDTTLHTGAKVQQILLVLPGRNFKKSSLRSTVYPQNNVIHKEDIARGLTNALNTYIDPDVTILNAVPVKYYVNGIAFRRLPEKEPCEEMKIDIDLLCADKEMTYELVGLIEECGVRVLDICLDSYAIAKEAALFEQSFNRNVVIADIGNSSTCFTLLSKGRIINSQIVEKGLFSLIQPVYLRYHIPLNSIVRMLKYNVDFLSRYPDDAIYAYDEKGEKVITVKDLNAVVEKPLTDLISYYLETCAPIIEAGEVEFILTGHGSDMKALVLKFKELAGSETRAYYPETIGMRDSRLSALYGCFFVYKEKAYLNDLNVECLDLSEYEALVDRRKVDNDGESLTVKIKKYIEQVKNREDK